MDSVLKSLAWRGKARHMRLRDKKYIEKTAGLQEKLLLAHKAKSTKYLMDNKGDNSDHLSIYTLLD
jgi:hypothetical protein